MLMLLVLVEIGSRTSRNAFYCYRLESGSCLNAYTVVIFRNEYKNYQISRINGLREMRKGYIAISRNRRRLLENNEQNRYTTKPRAQSSRRSAPPLSTDNRILSPLSTSLNCNQVRNMWKMKTMKRPTVSSLVLCKLSISSILARTLSKESSNPSSSTISIAACRISIESGRTRWSTWWVVIIGYHSDAG